MNTSDEPSEGEARVRRVGGEGVSRIICTIAGRHRVRGEPQPHWTTLTKQNCRYFFLFCRFLNYNMDYNRLIQSNDDVFTKIKQYKIHSRNRSEHLNLRSKNTFNRTSTKISQTVEGTSREMCHLPPKPLF